MSIRAVLVGFSLAMLVAVTGHFNDAYMQQTLMVGNFFPLSVVGAVLVIVLTIAPALFFIRKAWKFSAAELAVIVALPLTVCVVPGSGFLRTFTSVMVLPRHYEALNASWQRSDVLSYIPDHLLAGGPHANEEEYLAGFLQGQGRSGEPIGLSDIPWQAWKAPLASWLPAFGLLMIGLIGLSVVLHRQWTTHEHLVYPVAEVITRLTNVAKGSPWPPAFRNRLFWTGCLPVLTLHIVNGIHAWFPGWIRIPRHVDLRPLMELFPRLAQIRGGYFLFYSAVYFTVVAFAYFLPSDISLSLGLTNLIAGLFMVTLMTYGVTLSNAWIGAGGIQGLMFGAYAVLIGMILYSGRRYYTDVVAAALGGHRRSPHVERAAVWGLRLFGVCSILTMAMFARFGLPIPYAVLLVLFLIVLFVGMSRICAETGLFFLQPNWQPAGVLLGLFGAAALGPQVLGISLLICTVVSIDAREAMMPFVVNALKIAENAGVRRGRLAVTMGMTLIVGLLVGLTAVLWLQYDRGVSLADGWAARLVPTMGFNVLDQSIQELQAADQLQAATAASWASRLRLWHPKAEFMQFMLVGAGLFGLFSFFRRRFVWWPLHPVLFLAWFTYPIWMFGTSFFIGWMVKTLVVKLGGGTAYQRLKPLMIGMIAGELLGGLIFMIAGWIYYARTGFPPPTYSL